MKTLEEIFKKYDHPLENLNLKESNCFLCGIDMGNQVTQEDLFPKWLQRKHNLWNQKLILLNGTSINYSQLKIPCCAKCNNEYLSRLENTISNAINAGYKATLELDDKLIFYWASKILFGIIRKELTLLLDRSSPDFGTIVTKDLVESYDNLHAFIQGIRRKMIFVDHLPFSVLITNLHDLGDPTNFSFRDSILGKTFGLRSGEVGIIVATSDAGLNNFSYARYLKDVNGRKLHPIQFDELFAKVTYESLRLTKDPTFTIVSNKDSELPVHIITHIPYMKLKDWDNNEFSRLLGDVLSKWGLSKEELFVPPNKIYTYMTNEDGSMTFIDKNDDVII